MGAVWRYKGREREPQLQSATLEAIPFLSGPFRHTKQPHRLGPPFTVSHLQTAWESPFTRLPLSLSLSLCLSPSCRHILHMKSCAFLFFFKPGAFHLLCGMTTTSLNFSYLIHWVSAYLFISLSLCLSYALSVSFSWSLSLSVWTIDLMGRYIPFITPMLHVALLGWLCRDLQSQLAPLTDTGRQGGDTELLLRQHGSSAAQCYTA